MNVNELVFDSRDCPAPKSVATPIVGKSRGRGLLEKEKTLFVIVNSLDVLFTNLLISTGSFVEYNPLADFFISHFGMLGMTLFKLVLVAMVMFVVNIIAGRTYSTARAVLNFGSLITGAVVLYSAYLLAGFYGVV